MKKVSVTKSETDKKVKLLKDSKASFSLKRIGGSTEIVYMGKKYKDRDSSGQVSGCHLSALVTKNVQQRIDKGLFVPNNQNNERVKIFNVMIDPENTKKFIGKKCKSIDINSCYFNTAHIIGAIDDEVHKRGFVDNKGNDKSKDWKNARNIAIGSLGARILEEKYINGKPYIYDGKPYYCHNRELNVVRLDVIDHVWQVAKKIAKKCHSGFAFYLTDAFCVEEKYEDDVIRMLKEEGYKCKSENIVIKQLYQKSQHQDLYYCVWDKWKDGEEYKKEVDKRIIFHKNQFVTWRTWTKWML